MPILTTSSLASRTLEFCGSGARADTGYVYGRCEINLFIVVFLEVEKESMGKVSKLVLDAGPLINLTREEINSQGEQLYATPAVIREIRDEDARRRLELMKGEITVLQPSPSSVLHATNFAKLTGDSIVLSVQDIEVIALAYELVEDKSQLRQRPAVASSDREVVVDNENANDQSDVSQDRVDDDGFIIVGSKAPQPPKKPAVKKKPEAPTAQLQDLKIENVEDDEDEWSDDGWINPENVKEKMQGEGAKATPLVEDIAVAVSSRDYAVQNTALQMGLCAVNERGLRIKQLKSYMQRCYACFKLIPLGQDGVQTRQFCPQCGGHTLTRVSTSVDKYGKLHVHLKAKMQWITRGDRYNVPNPQSRRARRQQHDTKKEFYAEDQPEYIKALKKQHYQQRQNERMINQYVGPSTVDSAMSPFAPTRQMTSHIRIGRGRNANETGKKSESGL